MNVNRNLLTGFGQKILEYILEFKISVLNNVEIEDEKLNKALERNRLARECIQSSLDNDLNTMNINVSSVDNEEIEYYKELLYSLENELLLVDNE